jgi:hypothetical protein
VPVPVQFVTKDGKTYRSTQIMGKPEEKKEGKKEASLVTTLTKAEIRKTINGKKKKKTQKNQKTVLRTALRRPHALSWSVA